MTDSALFYEVLSNIASLRSASYKIQPAQDEALKYHGMAISLVNERLRGQRLSDGTIGTVLAFAVFSVNVMHSFYSSSEITDNV